MRIDHREIGYGHPTFIVAEIGGSHGGVFANAMKLIDAAAQSGADAVKFVTARPEDLTADSPDPRFHVKQGPWAGRGLYGLYEEFCMPLEWHEALIHHAKEHGLLWFSTPQSTELVDFLQDLDCPAYKIASPEMDYTRLVNHALRTGKPVIISTGSWSMEDVERMMTRTLKYVGQVALLHCVSAYPTPVGQSNLYRLLRLRSLYGPATPFQSQVGISDHSVEPPDVIPIMAVALGARIIEKHLRLTDVTSLDDGHALTPEQFTNMVERVRLAGDALERRKGHIEASAEQFKRRWIGDTYVRCGPETPRPAERET